MNAPSDGRIEFIRCKELRNFATFDERQTKKKKKAADEEDKSRAQSSAAVCV